MINPAIRIAKEFHRLIGERLPDDVEEVDRLNALEANRDTYCATHEFCDANVYMNEAFRIILGGDADFDDEDDMRAWNGAWNVAMDYGFSREWKD